MRLSLEQEDKDLQAVFQKEKVPFKDLSGKQKIQHLWNYHRWKILLPLLAVVIAIGAVYFLDIGKKNYILISLLNSTADITNYEEIQTEFAKYAGVDLEEYDIPVEALTAEFSTREQIAVKFYAKTVDVVLCDEDTFSLYYENGCFAPIEDYIPEDFYETYPFEPLTYYNKQDKTEHIYGIVLKDNDLLRKYFVDPPVFAVSLKAPHKEAAAEYLQYLLEMQNDYTKNTAVTRK